MAANTTNLSFFVFVVVTANPARVLPLPLPHVERQRFGRLPEQENACRDQKGEDPDQRREKQDQAKVGFEQEERNDDVSSQTQIRKKGINQ